MPFWGECVDIFVFSLLYVKNDISVNLRQKFDFELIYQYRKLPYLAVWKGVNKVDKSVLVVFSGTTWCVAQQPYEC